jgi:molybdopterin-guanine dinucleotide biosynthesis protein
MERRGDVMRTIVAVGGFSSEVGKTTLLCEFLRAFPGWEAIKMTRGHYRSCGKDPHACCVSHLLSDEPVIRSGRAQTYAPGKDTGRYWEAGASNVHWVIVTDNQVEHGIRLALERVAAPGVLIEGNSFLEFVDVDFAVMVARASGGKIKASARRALRKSSALYLFDGGDSAPAAREKSGSWRDDPFYRDLVGGLPVYTGDTLPQLIVSLQSLHSTRGRDGANHPAAGTDAR